MENTTQELLLQARSGQTLYLPAVREKYALLPGDARTHVGLSLGGQSYDIPMPRLAGCTAEQQEFVLEYVLAQAFNLLSCLGGRELGISGGEEAEAVHGRLRETLGLGGGHAAVAARHGGVVRVINRMLTALEPDGGARFRLARADNDVPRSAASGGAGRQDVAVALRAAAEGLENRAILGIDIGGTDIKLALAVNGRLHCLKEFDWFPTRFTSADEFIRPLLVLIRLMAAASVPAHGQALRGALEKGVTVGEMEAALAGIPEVAARFDAIGISFPDVVVADRIVGGETPKTKGMRIALGARYDAEFARLTRLADEFRPWVSGERAVFIVNDGPMAAFTAGVELAWTRPEAVEKGVFAHTLGTDFGSGWVTPEGRIPDLPLELYNCVLDLGSYPEREFHPDDVRSINNMNSGIPGAMQKFAGQGGVFRLVQKYLPERRPDLYREIVDKGYIVPEVIDGQEVLVVPVAPQDMRKPFLEHIMALTGREDCPEVGDIFREIGRSLGMAAREIDWMLRPGLETRILFGRLVKNHRCFELMREGAHAVNPHGLLEAADNDMAVTPLMRDLAAAPGYTVAQFAQAVGAVHYANSRLQAR